MSNFKKVYLQIIKLVYKFQERCLSRDEWWSPFMCRRWDSPLQSRSSSLYVMTVDGRLPATRICIRDISMPKREVPGSRGLNFAQLVTVHCRGFGGWWHLSSPFCLLLSLSLCLTLPSFLPPLLSLFRSFFVSLSLFFFFVYLYLVSLPSHGFESRLVRVRSESVPSFRASLV